MPHKKDEIMENMLEGYERLQQICNEQQETINALRNQQHQPQNQSNSMNPINQQPAPPMPTQYGYNMQQQPQPQQAQPPQRIP